MDSNERCNLAIEILRKTRDGNDLFVDPEVRYQRRPGDGWQLYVVENAINGMLGDEGYELFRRLHHQVMVNDFFYSADEFVEKFASDLGRKDDVSQPIAPMSQGDA